MTRPSDAAPEQAGEAQEALSEEEREKIVNYFLHGSDGSRLVAAVESILATRRAAWEAERVAIQSEARASGAVDALLGAAKFAEEIHCGYASQSIRSVQAIRKWLRARARALRAASTEGGGE